jgi:protein-S-isoprenylcysteine O-methyltransferase Ste14
MLLMAVVLVLRRSKPASESTSPSPSGRTEALLIAAIVTALLPMSFVFSVNSTSIRWLMWRDEPVWAGVCLALAIAFAIAWRRSRVRASDGEDEPRAGTAQGDSGAGA